MTFIDGCYLSIVEIQWLGTHQLGAELTYYCHYQLPTWGGSSISTTLGFIILGVLVPRENSTVKICKSPIRPEATAVASRHFRLLLLRRQQAQKGVILLAGVTGPNKENAGLFLPYREE